MILIDEVPLYLVMTLTLVLLNYAGTNGSRGHPQSIHCKSIESPEHDHLRSFLRIHYFATPHARIQETMS